MNTDYKNSIVELWQNEFGAKKCVLEGEYCDVDCYRIKDTYIRLCTFRAIDEGMIYCIEAAPLDEARNNIFDDAYTYWSGDKLDDILKQMRKDIRELLEQAS